MTIASPPAAGGSGTIWRRVPLLALLLALAALVLLALGPIGWRLGWWNFGVAFFSLMPWAAYCGLAAMAVAILALLFGRRSLRGWPVAAAAVALLLGAVITYVPWHYNSMRGTLPSIHDITTDWQHPPQFSAVLPSRQAEKANPVDYEGAKVSDQQRQAYPDIAPLELAIPAAAAFDRALEVARRMGWNIVAADKEAGRIEASEKSRWFGFTDDIVIRVTPMEGGAEPDSRVDVRSVSRVGRGDFGVNAARVRRYLAALRTGS
jgi:uncharacterized protein (DUF1499 family)